MKFFDNIYDDFDYKRNIRIKFKTLIMKIQNFQSFFSIFLFLSSQIDYNETQKIEKLFEKFSFSLKKTLSIYFRQFVTFVEIKIELTQMYNNQERITKKRVEKKTRLIATSQELEKYQELDLKKSSQVLKVELEACLDVKLKFLILASSLSSSRRSRLEAWLDIKSSFRLELETWLEQLENTQIWSKYYVLRKSNAKR